MVFDLHVVFDCADPDRVARFWMAALEGYDFPSGPPDGHDSWDAWADANGIPEDQRNLGRTLVDKVGHRPDIFFLKVPEAKTVKNRLHLDIKATAGLAGADQARARIESEVARLVAAGATVARRFDSADDFHVIMRDVERNEFCVT